MELLFEFEGSRRRLNPPSSAAVVEFVTAAIREVDRDASISLGNDSDVEPRAKYLLQRWSRKWSEFVDVMELHEVKDGDKLTVLPRPTKSCTVS